MTGMEHGRVYTISPHHEPREWTPRRSAAEIEQAIRTQIRADIEEVASRRFGDYRKGMIRAARIAGGEDR